MKYVCIYNVKAWLSGRCRNSVSYLTSFNKALSVTTSKSGFKLRTVNRRIRPKILLSTDTQRSKNLWLTFLPQLDLKAVTILLPLQDWWFILHGTKVFLTWSPVVTWNEVTFYRQDWVTPASAQESLKKENLKLNIKVISSRHNHD